MTREVSIDVYRVALMYGICVLHAITFGNVNCAWVSNVLCSCVVGFVLISGWFGIRFSVWKVLKLYGIGFYAAFVYSVLSWCLGDVTDVMGMLQVGLGQFLNGFWFLHAYVVLMMFAPLINAGLKYVNRGGALLWPILLLVWGWGFGKTLPLIGDYLPNTAGIDAYGGLTLVAIYAAMRWVRETEVLSKLKTWQCGVILLLSLLLTGLGLGDYNSPFAFALACMWFVLYKRIRMPRWLSSLCVALGPSMFSVYLLHTNGLGGQFIANGEVWWQNTLGCPISLSVLLTASVVFCSACLLDLPRRLFVKGVISLRRYVTICNI